MNFRFKNVRNYIRDISIVIVGIVITFAGSELITRMAKKKETKRVMELIKEEIEDNTKALKTLIQRIEKDGNFYKYLIDNENVSVQELSVDTLKLNMTSMYETYGMTLRSDAFELLKSSSLIQYVKNKELLIKINESYDLMTLTQITIDIYFDHKSRVSMEVFENVSKEKLNRMLKGENVLEFYETFLNDSKMWYFMIFRNNYIKANGFSETLEKLDEIIALINKEYGFKD